MSAHASDSLRVIPLGIGGAFTSHEYFCSLLILGGETCCLVDCPDTLLKLLHDESRQAGVPLAPEDVRDVLLTHLHGDHSNGLEPFLFYRRFIARAPLPVIHALPEVVADLWPRKLAVSMEHSYCPAIGIDERYDASDFYSAHAVDEGTPFRVGPLTFEVFRTLHTLPTFGFRVSCGGRMFGYSCDTAFDPRLIEFLAPADLIFHECGNEPLHTPYSRLVSLPAETRAKIHILHLNDQFDRAHSELPVVEPGRLYTV